MSKLLTGVLIDPFTKTISEVEIEATLEAMYELLQCRYVDRMSITPNVDLWIDDEGLFKEPPDQAYFYFVDYLEPIAGRALLLGVSKGESRSLMTKRAEIEPHIQWVNSEVKGFRPPQPEAPELWLLDNEGKTIRRLE